MCLEVGTLGPAEHNTDLQAPTDCIGLSIEHCLSRSNGRTVECSSDNLIQPVSTCKSVLCSARPKTPNLQTHQEVYADDLAEAVDRLLIFPCGRSKLPNVISFSLYFGGMFPLIVLALSDCLPGDDEPPPPHSSTHCHKIKGDLVLFPLFQQNLLPGFMVNQRLLVDRL